MLKIFSEPTLTPPFTLKVWVFSSVPILQIVVYIYIDIYLVARLLELEMHRVSFGSINDILLNEPKTLEWLLHSDFFA